MSVPTSGPSARGAHPWPHQVTDFLHQPRTADTPGPATTDSTSLGRMRTTARDRPGPHDQVGAPPRAKTPAAPTSLDPAELPLALRSLLGPCAMRSVPAYSPTGVPSRETVPPEGALLGATMRLRDSTGGTFVVERPAQPFSPDEFAGARALVSLGVADPRQSRGQSPAALPVGEGVTVRAVGDEVHAQALDLHTRCSGATLRLRYHGPLDGVDGHLGHLLSPRFGRSLGACTASGRLVGLGHLLEDGDEAEVALLVEDAWQQRGVGSALLHRLAVLALRDGRSSLYAVTGRGNSGMVAAMRELGLPLAYQVEDTAVVITAPLDHGVAHSLTRDGGAGLFAAGHAEH